MTNLTKPFAVWKSRCSLRGILGAAQIDAIHDAIELRAHVESRPEVFILSVDWEDFERMTADDERLSKFYDNVLDLYPLALNARLSTRLKPV